MTPPVKGERERVALSPRNETAACALVLELLTEAGEAAAAVLPVARALCDTALAPPSGDDAGAAGAAPPDDAGVGDAMIAWTRAGGPAASTSGAGAETSETSVRVSIVPARFPSTGRGAAAAADLPAGSDAVRVPFADAVDRAPRVRRARRARRGVPHVRRARRGHRRRAVAGVRARSAGRGVAVGAVARRPPPRRGADARVVAPEATAALLGGTPVCADAMETRSTLARQYAALFPALAEHYPDAFPAAAYTFDAFRAPRRGVGTL